MKVQRLRLRYRLLPVACSLSQREIVRAWEEAAEAAGLRIAYSEGKRPAAQISVAAPLPQGVTSDCELVDIFMAERADPAEALARLSEHMSEGLEATGAWEVGLNAPSLQSQLRWAEYEVAVPAGELTPPQVQRAIDRLLAADTFPWERRRPAGLAAGGETRVRSYDLRPLVLSLRLDGERDGCLVLSMRLRAEQEMTGRADQVALALGLPEPYRAHRRCLHVEEMQPAILAYRRLGEPDRE